MPKGQTQKNGTKRSGKKLKTLTSTGNGNRSSPFISGMKTKSYATARNTVFGSPKKKKATASRKAPVIDKSIFEKIGVKSSPGMSDGIKKTNQDSFFKETILLAGEKTTLLVVMDGHGLEGHRCSANLKNNISSIFKTTF